MICLWGVIEYVVGKFGNCYYLKLVFVRDEILVYDFFDLWFVVVIVDSGSLICVVV